VRYLENIAEYCLMAGMVVAAVVGAMPGLSATGSNLFLQIGSIITVVVQ
jgi:Flp pilus assembly pilin Flp